MTIGRAWQFVERLHDVALAAAGLPRLTDHPYIEGPAMALLSRDQILAAEDRQYETVAVPEWGGEVRVRSLTGVERDRWEASMIQQVGNTTKTDLANARAKLVAACACDETGRPLFPDAKDVIALGKKSSAALDRLFTVCQRLSGLTDEDVKELEGNSEPAQSGPSTSDSVSPSASPSMNSSHASAPVASPSTWPSNGSTAPSVHAAPTTTQH